VFTHEDLDFWFRVAQAQPQMAHTNKILDICFIAMAERLPGQGKERVKAIRCMQILRYI